MKNLDSIKEMKGWRRYFGLMLSEENSEPIMFKMKTPKAQSIHSLCCPVFTAHWYLKGKKIGEELIYSGRLKIDPPGEWDTLIEVPIGHAKIEGEGK